MRDARRSLLATWLAALAQVAGCGADVFRCEQASDCAGAGADAQCEPTGHCSVSDPTCDSGRRYAEHGGDLAGTCVPPGVAGTDGDTTTTTTATSTSTTGVESESSTGAITVTEASLTSADGSSGVGDSSGEVSTGPITTEDSASVSSDESSTGSGGHGGEQCSACLIDANNRQCNPELNMCAGDAQCVEIATCIGECIQADDPNCAAGCCEMNPVSDAYNNLANCDLRACADVCVEFAVICG